jgi:hypothetical protein
MTLVGFAAQIRPLFREQDRVEMEFVFDLWSYESVRDEAKNILERLEDGTMPCDAPWPEAQTELFREWIESGCAP